MASNAVRRPLPALISLVALLLLTGLVWWRVINRDDATTHTAGKHCATTSSTPPPPAQALPTTTLPKPSTVQVLVLNSTKRTGIAADARTGLQSAGFRSPRQAANFTGKATIAGVGQLRYGATAKDAAELLRYYLPGVTLVQTKAASALVTVVLGPTYDGVLSSAQVQKAMAAQRATTSGTATATSTSSSKSTAASSTC